MALRRALLLVLATLLALSGCGTGAGEDPEATETVTETVTVSQDPTPSPTPTPTTTPTPTPSPTDDSTTAVPSPSPQPAAGVPRSYDEALAKFDAAGQEPVSYRRFTTADGNIFCLLSDKALQPGCEIAEGGVRDPEACAGAPSPVVGRIELTPGQARPVCNTDSIRSDMPDVLARGEVAQSGDVQCLAEKRGVTCISVSSEVGFFLGRGKYVVLGS